MSLCTYQDGDNYNGILTVATCHTNKYYFKDGNAINLF